MRQSAVALLDDKDLGALKAMTPHKKGHLTKARMKPIMDSYLEGSDTRQYVAASTGTGKTHVCLALGLAACQRGFSVDFFTAAGLVHQLMEARDERRLLKLQAQLAAVKLLILADSDPSRPPKRDDRAH